MNSKINCHADIGKVLLLDVQIQMTIFNQSKHILSVLHGFVMLKYVVKSGPGSF